MQAADLPVLPLRDEKACIGSIAYCTTDSSLGCRIEWYQRDAQREPVTTGKALQAIVIRSAIVPDRLPLAAPQRSTSDFRCPTPPPETGHLFIGRRVVAHPDVGAGRPEDRSCLVVRYLLLAQRTMGLPGVCFATSSLNRERLLE